MKKLFLFLALFSAHFSFAQKTGKMEYPSLGLSFSIPSGWVGQETEAGFLMGSNTIPGFIFISTIDINTLSEMKLEARKGIADGNGTTLQLVGELEKISGNSFGGQYEGILERQSVKAYIIGIANPLGPGVTIITATTPETYSDVHPQTGKQVAQSVHFFNPVPPDVVKEWGEALKNARLTYMDSYYSNDGAYGNSGYTIGGGYRDKEEIDLCAAGYFKHSSSSSMSFDAGGGFGSSHDSGQGAGTWMVKANAQGQAVLQLNFYNGEVYEYLISSDDGKTFLNGKRYFRTYGTTADDGPDCN